MRIKIWGKWLIFGLSIVCIVKLWPAKIIHDKKDKILHLPIPRPIDSLDPACTVNSCAIQLFSKVYEGLLSYHYLKRPFELIPNLAENMPTISKDGLVYTFTLKKGVFFHDNPCFPNGKGRELSAEDVVYSFKRIADPATRSPYFVNFKDIIVDFDQLYDHLKHHKGDYSFSILGIKAIDPYTVQFTLKKPFPLFLYYIAMSCGSILAKEAIDYYGDSFMNHPVGTGPFILDHFNPQDNKFVFVKNYKFRNKFFPTEASKVFQQLLGSAGEKVPFLDKIIYHLIPEEIPRWLQFKNKTIDLLPVSSDYLLDIFDDHSLLNEKLKQENIELHKIGRFMDTFVGFNCLKAPLDNKKVRQAMSLAFDRQTFNRLFLRNLGKTPNTFIHEGFLGYDETFVNPYDYNLEQAKKYLTKAGYPKGQGLPTISLLCAIGPALKAQAEFFAKCMEKIGIKIEIQQLIFPELCKKLDQHQYMLSMIHWMPDYPDAASTLFTLMRTGQSGINMGDIDFNKQYDNSIILRDLKQKEAAYKALNVLAIELTPAILLPQLPFYVLKHNYVKNFTMDMYNLGPELYWDVANKT